MSWRRVIAMVLGGLATLYFGVVLLLQRKVLFPAPEIRPSAIRPREVTQVWLTPGGERVEAWYLPPADPPKVPAAALIYFHGNAELIDFLPYDFNGIRRRGVAVLLVEFPGYGRSGGSPSQTSISATALAAYDWLSSQPLVDRHRLVAYGRSMGGAAAAILGAHRKPAAIVLESTFTSVRSFAHRFWVPEFAVLDPFDNVAAIKMYAGPLLVLHGKDDRLVPVDHAILLAQASRRSVLHLLACGHNDCDRPWTLVEAFLEANGIVGN
jgi:uncharacterized protein